MPRKPAPEWIARKGCSVYGLTAIERSVLLLLWDHANANNEAWMKPVNMAAETGFSERSMKYATDVLFRRGFMRRADGRQPGEKMPHDRRTVHWILSADPASVVHLVH